jgi:hypothetical protein
MDIPNCTASGFAEMELGRKSKKGKCISTDCKVLLPDYVFGYRRAGKTML